MAAEPQQDSPFEVQASLGGEEAPESDPSPAPPAPESSEPMAMDPSAQGGAASAEQPGDAAGQPGSAPMPAVSSGGAEQMEVEPANGAAVSAPAGAPNVPPLIVVPGKSSSDTADGGNGRAGPPPKEESPRSDASPNQPQKSPPRPRKPHLQGRFSGRLETKDDEKTLQEECRALGPLVGGAGKRGEKSRMTLAKIVRAIATGEVRRHCTMREEKITELQEKLKTMEAVYRREMELLKQDNNALRLKLELQGADDFNHRQIPHMLRPGVKGNNSHEPRVIITPATVPPMVVVRNGPNARYSGSEAMTSIAGGVPPADAPIPFLLPSAQGAQLQQIPANSPMARTGRVAQLGSLGAATAAQARALAQVGLRGPDAAGNLSLKRKLQEMQGSGGDRGGDGGREEAMHRRLAVSREMALPEAVAASSGLAANRNDGLLRAFQMQATSKAPQVLQVLPAQVFPVSQDASPTAFGNTARGGSLPQQQFAFLSVPNYAPGEGVSNPGVTPALNLLGAQSGLQQRHSGANDMHTPTVALTLGDDMAAQHFSQQAGFSGQKAVIVSNIQAANAALTSTGPFASHLLSGQIGLDNVIGHIPLSEALASSAPMVIGGREMAPTLEDSALSAPMETEMDPNIIEQLNAGDLDLSTVAATIPILQGAGGGAPIAMMPATQVLRMSSEAGRPVG
eukprot:evm.model.scf_458.5 EVM.evm.TU.scf_458.5   scf_458:40699-45583(-)